MPRELTYAEALREAMREEMKKDKNVFLIGEDVGQGYRGCFAVSTGLYEEFGQKQIIDTPISENTILGCGIGASLLGMKPIVEMMFEDFISVAFDGILNQAAKVRLMSAEQYKLNLVVRLPGGSKNGTGPQHSQCLESIFMSIPGIKIVCPVTPHDAKGLLKEAINHEDPVIFFEHKKLYSLKGEVPEEEYTIPFGKARIAREGKDLTVIAVSYMVNVALEAAEILKEKHNLDIEIIDPRTLVPFDLETVGKSIKKTSKTVIIEEGIKRNGVGSEISSLIMENLFDYLDFPVKRIASRNSIIPMSPLLEKEVIPNKESVVKQIEDLLIL
ncbi:MAG: alpha-ketoacid dehydrogenase subunit beta [Actinobacteria bacterium]|nr:alpha-ketoacid dehydrogenase subunit beta [Actinomycetota bacterium]